jgi:hypothetical protein
MYECKRESVSKSHAMPKERFRPDAITARHRNTDGLLHWTTGTGNLASDLGRHDGDSATG